MKRIQYYKQHPTLWTQLISPHLAFSLKAQRTRSCLYCFYSAAHSKSRAWTVSQSWSAHACLYCWWNSDSAHSSLYCCTISNILGCALFLVWRRVPGKLGLMKHTRMFSRKFNVSGKHHKYYTASQLKQFKTDKLMYRPTIPYCIYIV